MKVGDSIVGVVNAGGDGGSSSAARGTVATLDQSITVQSESGGASEKLNNLIQVSADIISGDSGDSGDSGGPLYNDGGKVIGMDTAASSGTPQVSGFAIPIASALSIADRIEQRTESGAVSIGYPAFLGVEIAQSTGLGGTASDAATVALVQGPVA